MNAPPRIATMSKDQLIRESSFSPKAHSRRKYDIASYKVVGTERASNGAPPRKNANLKAHTENQSPFQAQVKDYTMLVSNAASHVAHKIQSSISAPLLYFECVAGCLPPSHLGVLIPACGSAPDGGRSLFLHGGALRQHGTIF